jgi:LuxR family maltose regulon positive regulatory protein
MPREFARHIIERPRLRELLENTDARVIALIAPAGYGKTTLAQQWLDSRRAVWFRTTPSASDVAALATGLAAALAPLIPSAKRRLEAWLKATPNPETDALAAARILADEVCEWPADAWLAIDDFHVIENDRAAQTFFEYLEAETAMNLLVTARHRPSWVSARRLLYGEVFEVGASALAMTADEANTVLRTGFAASPPGLVALAEGWPAVIGLAALAGETDAPPDSVVPRGLYDFFADELFQTLAPGLRRDLCLLAPATRINVALACDVLGPERGPQLVGEGVRLGFLSASGVDELVVPSPLSRVSLDEGSRV